MTTFLWTLSTYVSLLFKLLACWYNVEDTGLRLSADTIAGPAENTAVVHFCPWYVVQNALRPIYSGKCKYNIRKENVQQSGTQTTSVFLKSVLIFFKGFFTLTTL